MSRSACRSRPARSRDGRGGQHAAPADGGGGLEARLAPVEQPQAGGHAALRVARRASQRGLRVAPVALFLAGSRRRLRCRAGLLAGGLRWRLLRGRVALGCLTGASRRALAGGQQALLAVAPQRRGRHAQFLGHAVQAEPGVEHPGGADQQLGVLDAVPTALLAGQGEAALAVLLEARLGAGHGARVEVEGLGQGGLRGEAEQGVAAEAEIAAELVVDGVGGDGVGVEEVHDLVAVTGQAETGAEREGLVGLEAESGGQRGGLREGLVAFHRTYYIARYWACQVPRSAGGGTSNFRSSRQLRGSQALRYLSRCNEVWCIVWSPSRCN